MLKGENCDKWTFYGIIKNCIIPCIYLKVNTLQLKLMKT
jgi:hypothetical protein